MPGGFSGLRGAEVTPGRTVSIVLDPNERIMHRPPWRFRRDGEHISRYAYRGKTLAPITLSGYRQEPVWLAPGGCWTINPYQGELSSVIKGDYPNPEIKQVVVPPNLKTVKLQNTRNFTVAGLEPTTALNAGPVAYVKRVAAGLTWGGGDNRLVNDQIAFPGPTPASDQTVPLDRVMVSTPTFIENAAFVLVFGINQSWYGTDAFLQFYFGGAADVRPFRGDAGTLSGGEFCIQLRGGGKGILFERNGVVWERRMEFRWAGSNRMNDGIGTLAVYPYIENRIQINCNTAETPFDAGSQPGLAYVFQRRSDTISAAYVESSTLSGHTHVRSMTGRGNVRVDIRRDYRQPFTVARLMCQQTAVLVDAPFALDFNVPAATSITCTPITYTKLGGSVSVQLYNAADETALTKNADGTFQSVAGQRAYYPAFTFTAGDSGLLLEGFTTMKQDINPVLYGYTVDVPAVQGNRTGGAVSGSSWRNVSITGPGLAYNEDSASVSYKDVGNKFTRLRKRGRIRTQIRCATSADTRGYTILFDGETTDPDNLLRGRTRNEGQTQSGAVQNWPSSEWRDYEPLKMVGMAARLDDQPTAIHDFRSDPNAPFDPSIAGTQTYRVTEALSLILKGAGFPKDDDISLSMQQIPDEWMRFPVGPDNNLDQLIQLNMSSGAIAQKFAIAYLGRPLIWDPNAGTYGKWRLIYNPVQPAAGWASHPNILAEFRYTGPTGATKRIRYQEGAYGATNITWIQKDSYRTYVHPPEFNYLVVSAIGDINTSTGELLTKAWWNKDSFNIDPDNPTATDVEHPDYLGRNVPCYVPDLKGASEAGVALTLKRLADFAGHGEKMVKWRSPLLLVNDPLDTDTSTVGRVRPLRINDVVKVRDVVAIIRSVQTDFRHSSLMMADYHAKFVG